jgi:hypothetical protein
MASIIPSETKHNNLEVSKHENHYSDAKKQDVQVHLAETISQEEEKNPAIRPPPASARELVAQILTLEDDPSLNPWTFRMWFIGIGMSVFAG